MTTTLVYLIEAENRLVKIGYGFPEARLATVRTHSPVLARIIAQWPGGHAEEQGLHSKYSAHRNHLEWFRMEADFLEFVESVRGTGVGEIEPWSDLLYESRSDRRAKRRLRSTSGIKACWADPKWKLHQIGQLLSSRMEKKEFGGLGIAGRTSAGHRRAHEIHKEAHRIVRASPVGLALLAKIEANSSSGMPA